jgi:hypothetical protein
LNPARAFNVEVRKALGASPGDRTEQMKKTNNRGLNLTIASTSTQTNLKQTKYTPNAAGSVTVVAERILSRVLYMPFEIPTVA